jgi:hypothetical protein
MEPESESKSEPEPEPPALEMKQTTLAPYGTAPLRMGSDFALVPDAEGLPQITVDVPTKPRHQQHPDLAAYHGTNIDGGGHNGDARRIFADLELTTAPWGWCDPLSSTHVQLWPRS